MSDLEQYCILAKNQKGLACSALIQQVLNNKKIFYFSEFLSIPSVIALNDSQEYVKSYKTLYLFAYKTYNDYKSNTSEYLELSENLLMKLKLLTILTIAETMANIPYELLQKELDICSIRQLEDLIIDGIYMSLIKCKLDQKAQVMHIIEIQRRDVPINQINSIIETLNKWKLSCSNLRGNLNISSSGLQVKRDIYKQDEEHLFQIASHNKKVILSQQKDHQNRVDRKQN